MTKAQSRIKYLFTALLFVVSVLSLQFGYVKFASAAPVTYQGGGGDTKFSTAANWVGGVVPTNGDTIIFTTGSSNTGLSVNNDIVGLNVAGITATGVNGYTTTITGQDLTVSGNITHNNAGSLVLDLNLKLATNVTMTGNVVFAGTGKSINIQNHNLTVSNPVAVCRAVNNVSGSGNISLSTPVADLSGYNFVTANSGFTGQISAISGSLVVGNANAFVNSTGIVVSGAGTLIVLSSADQTITTPITLSGSGSISAQNGGSSCTVKRANTNRNVVTTTLAGPLTLLSDFAYSGVDEMKVTGALTSNGHVFSARNGAGTITTSDGAVTSTPFTTHITDTTGDTVLVVNKETLDLSGGRETIQVSPGATLKGTGTVNLLSNIGTVNPGNSPGKLTVKTAYVMGNGATHEVEVLNKDSYDQLVVGADFTSGGGYANPITLSSSGSFLKVILYDGWSITQGDQFTIADNRSDTAVSGTYDGLAEGAQFVVDGITFSITYVGGDGNDIVITALNTGSDPTPPNTGVAKQLLANPAVTVILGIVTAGLFAAFAIRRKSVR